LRDQPHHASRLAASIWPAQTATDRGGHRLYSDDDVQQALNILDWVQKGVPVSQIKPLLDNPVARQTNHWSSLQESMLQRLKEGKSTPCAS
jgi:DNA-binding transcriptional MerR regulator